MSPMTRMRAPIDARPANAAGSRTVLARMERGHIACLLALCAGCPGGGAVEPTGDGLFAPDHVVVVDIEMRAADWDALRAETRAAEDLIGEGCLTRPTTSPYTWFLADVSVDGVRYADVGVRKKGFYGSASDTKPSLKISLDRYVDGQSHQGIDALTLNNNIADPSQVKQCLGYGRFSAAGLPSSRCALAVVSVNGERIGTFTNVESIDRAFLRRHFDDDEGHLYEGALSDFRPQWVTTFEAKHDDDDRSDLDSVVAALEVDDASIEAALDTVVDLDRFIDHWALEVLLMHWDGYARQTNNFLVYRSSSSTRFTFIPWGMDVILQDDEALPWEVEGAPPGLAWAEGAIAHRLYRHPPTRARYLSRVRALLSDVWREEEMKDEIAVMRAAILPFIDAMPEGERALVLSSMDDVARFVDERRATIEARLDAEPPEWDRPLRAPWCLEPPTP